MSSVNEEKKSWYCLLSVTAPGEPSEAMKTGASRARSGATAKQPKSLGNMSFGQSEKLPHCHVHVAMRVRTTVALFHFELLMSL